MKLHSSESFSGDALFTHPSNASLFSSSVFTVTCGVFTSGLIFVAQDLMTEIHGEKESKKMVSTCYITAFAMTMLYQLSIICKGSAFWNMQEAYSSVLQTTVRITVASFIAYMTGSFLNIHIMSRLKKRIPNSLFVRSVSSTIVGQAFDNGLFAFIAFFNVLPLKAILSMIAGGTLIEIITEIAVYPLLRIGIRKRCKQ